MRVSDADIRFAPDGIEDCCLITFEGEILVSAFPEIFDRIRPVLTGDVLNIVSDYRRASLFANLHDLMAAYRYFHAHGIRTYRSVVIDKDPGRPLFQSFASAVGEQVGLRTAFAHVQEFQDAYPAMRDLIRRTRTPEMPTRSVSAEPVRLRDFGARLGLRYLATAAVTDIQMEPAGIRNSFMVHFNGSPTVPEAQEIVRQMKDMIVDGTLSVVSDERDAVPTASAETLADYYDTLWDMGVRRYNLVVVSNAPGRQEQLRHSQAIARSREIDTRFALAPYADIGLMRLRALLAEPAG